MKRGKDLLETIKGHGRRSCPLCSKDVSRTALVDCVYAFEPCECADAPYKHLVETVYHRDCFLAPRAGQRTVTHIPDSSGLTLPQLEAGKQALYSCSEDPSFDDVRKVIAAVAQSNPTK